MMLDALATAAVIALFAAPILLIMVGLLIVRLARQSQRLRWELEVHAGTKRRLADVETLRKRDEVWRPTHRHVDGGLYRLERDCAGKHPDTGAWVDGVLYTGEDAAWRWTAKDRWPVRFLALIRGEHAQGITIDGTDGWPPAGTPPPLRSTSPADVIVDSGIAYEPKPGDQVGYFDYSTPPHMADDGCDGTDLRHIHIMLDGEVEADREADAAKVPPMIRIHLGEPPFATEPAWDESGCTAGAGASPLREPLQ